VVLIRERVVIVNPDWPALKNLPHLPTVLAMNTESS